MAFSTFLGNEILDYFLRNTAPTAVTTNWISLHTADPGATGAAEATYTSYARIQVTSGFAVAVAKTTDNDAAITFPENTGGSQTVTHVGIWTLVTGGNFLIGGALVASRDITAGGIPEFAAADLDVTLT